VYPTRSFGKKRGLEAHGPPGINHALLIFMAFSRIPGLKSFSEFAINPEMEEFGIWAPKVKQRPVVNASGGGRKSISVARVVRSSHFAGLVPVVS
jgi:hypothetical protein